MLKILSASKDGTNPRTQPRPSIIRYNPPNKSTYRIWLKLIEVERPEVEVNRILNVLVKCG